MKNSRFQKAIRKVNWYPPFIGMGIRVRSHAQDFTRFEVEMKARWYNRNLFGTHFGGALYAMSDPFYAFIVTLHFGDGFIVWDKSAAIDFLQPARGTILGIFEINREQLAAMRAEVDSLGKHTFHFETDLVDEAGVAVARVKKEVYVRSKARKK